VSSSRLEEENHKYGRMQIDNMKGANMSWKRILERSRALEASERSMAASIMSLRGNFKTELCGDEYGS